jgi:hypothetical protein
VRDKEKSRLLCTELRNLVQVMAILGTLGKIRFSQGCATSVGEAERIANSASYKISTDGSMQRITGSRNYWPVKGKRWQKRACFA